MSFNQNLLDSSKSIFVLYLIISGNFLANLFGCRTQYSLTNLMWLKHILGFMTMYFFIVLVYSKSRWSTTPTTQLLFTILCYIIFIISTKMDYKWWIAFILILSTIYILQVYKDHYQTKEQYKQKYTTYQTYLSYLASITVIIGFIIYFGKKKIEYKDNFDLYTFLLGKPSCSFNADGNTSVSDYQGFIHAFK